MKSMLSVILVSFIVTGCSQHSKNISQQIKEMREDIAEDANINNTKALKWEKVIDSLYKVADTNPNLAIYVIEHLRKDTSLEQHQRVTLHFIKGDVYYRMDSLFQAVREFSADLQAPKYLAARAGAFIKLKEYGRAYIDLKKASALNYDYNWNMGNYYEIVGMKDAAITCYQQLYQKDTSIYRYCNTRINEILRPHPELLTELVFHDRKRGVLLMKGVQ